MTLDFSALTRVSLSSVNGMEELEVYGPSDEFTFNLIDGNVRSCVFWLLNTVSVHFNGLPESSDFGKSQIYLSYQQDVSFSCGVLDSAYCSCYMFDVPPAAEVWQPIGDSTAAVVSYGWDVSQDIINQENMAAMNPEAFAKCIVFNQTS